MLPFEAPSLSGFLFEKTAPATRWHLGLMGESGTQTNWDGCPALAIIGGGCDVNASLWSLIRCINSASNCAAVGPVRPFPGRRGRLKGLMRIEFAFSGLSTAEVRDGGSGLRL